MRLQPSLPLALCLALLLCACRESSAPTAGPAIVPSTAGSNGCLGPEQPFQQAKVLLGDLGIAFDVLSQVTAAGDAELLYATAANGMVYSIDVSAAPVATPLVNAGTVATLLASFGISDAPQLSGIAVLNAGNLLVMEHTAHILLRVSRAQADTVELFAGQPDVLGGFADGLAVPGSGPASPARFRFLAPTQLAPVSGDVVFVLDSGNHALRRVANGIVTTITGSGAPFFADGSLDDAGYDTPCGLTVTCSGTLLVTELGAAGAGGHRLRRLTVGQTTFLGTTGSAITVAGDGVPATVQGQGPAASLDGPVSPVATTGEEVYWIDSLSGILRRLTPPGDSVDCPLWVDCAAAVAGGGDFAGGGALSLTQTPSGQLYVLDARAGLLYSVGP